MNAKELTAALEAANVRIAELENAIKAQETYVFAFVNDTNKRIAALQAKPVTAPKPERKSGDVILSDGKKWLPSKEDIAHYLSVRKTDGSFTPADVYELLFK